MVEQWADIAGYEGRYQVSDLGRIKSLPFLQRCVSRKGKEFFRRTSEKILPLLPNNSGYLLVHLWLDGKRTAKTVHRLVACAFRGAPTAATVNHKSGDKRDNRAENLEWMTYSGNHLHAVAMRLRSAIRVTDPDTGVTYSSIAQAARALHRSHRKISAVFQRSEAA